jgi:hypothetical protein
MEHVFLSYSRRDAAFVGRLADDLLARGIEPWVDTDDLRTAGDDRWRRSVVRSIRDSAAVILVLSPDSVQSVSVERELTIAAELGRRIIPIVHRPCSLSDGVMFDLAGLQRTDFVDRSYAEAFEELLERVQAGAGRAVPTAPIEPPEGTRQQPGRRGGRRLVAGVAALALIAIGLVALSRIAGNGDDPGDGEAADAAATTSAASAPAPTSASARTTDVTLVPWDAAVATLERVDGTTADVKATTVTLACAAEQLEFKNGQTISLDRVESIRFDEIFLADGSASGAVLLLDGRELTDQIHTWNCPIGGTTELGPIQIPLEDIKRIDFSR